MRSLTAILLIFAVSISVNQIYAERATIDVPFQSNSLDCVFTSMNELLFVCKWTGDEIPMEVRVEIVELENKNDILPQEEIDAGVERILTEWITAPPFVPEPEPEPPKPSVRDILIEKLDPGVKEAVDRLAECQYGYDGWEAIQQQSFDEIPDQMIAFDGNLRNEVIVKRLNMAWQACDAQAKYPLSSMYQNFIDADLLGLDLYGRTPTHTFNEITTFDRYYYEPVTQFDLDDATKRAEEFKCSPTGRGLGHCIEEPTDINRGNPNPIIENLFDYYQYLSAKAGSVQTAQDYADTIKEARDAQCAWCARLHLSILVY